MGWRRSLQRALDRDGSSRRREDGKRADRQTSRDHETWPADGRTDELTAAGNRQSGQTIARHRQRHRRRHRPGQGTQDGILFRLRHAENSWGAKLSFGSIIGRVSSAADIAKASPDGRDTQCRRGRQTGRQAGDAVGGGAGVPERSSRCSACISSLACSPARTSQAFCAKGSTGSTGSTGSKWLPRWFERAAAPAGSPDQGAQTAW